MAIKLSELNLEVVKRDNNVDMNNFMDVDNINSNRLISLPSKLLISKNRYIDVLPYSDNRVNLKEIDYINASPIIGEHNHYIVASAPTPPLFGDWWNMIFEKEVGLVVMLTQEIEGISIKAHNYIPESSVKYENIIVSCDHSQDKKFSNTCMSKVILNSCKEVSVIKYLGWPDHGVPKNLESLKELFEVYHFEKIKIYNTPILVHCSAGIGRTGVFLLIDMTLSHISKSLSSDPLIDIPGTVVKLRTQRMGMIQTLEQYKLSWKFINYCVNNNFLTEPSDVFSSSADESSVLPLAIYFAIIILLFIFSFFINK